MGFTRRIENGGHELFLTDAKIRDDPIELRISTPAGAAGRAPRSLGSSLSGQEMSAAVEHRSSESALGRRRPLDRK